VARGETSIDSTLARRLLLEVGLRREREAIQEALTQRETMVLQCLAVGLTNRAIGRRLEISERTVRTHVSHILAKLQLHTRTQAALYAVRNGIAAPSEMQSEMQVEASNWASPDSRMRPTAASAK
jgi:DNA-binding NarL/FixJ family response regulator